MQTSVYVWQREIPSNSTPGKTYTVSQTSQGEWQCDCLAWTRRRLECRHIREAKAMQAAEAEQMNHPKPPKKKKRRKVK
jgi:hypothetical protein